MNVKVETVESVELKREFTNTTLASDLSQTKIKNSLKKTDNLLKQIKQLRIDFN